MTMDARIILAGRAPDILGNMGRGMQLGMARHEFDRQNALATAFQQHGAGAIQGDQGALNALAAFDPTMAMNLSSAHLGQQATRQGMAHDAERLDIARQQARMQAEEYARQRDAATLAADRDQLSRELRGLSYYHARGDRAGFEAALAQTDIDEAMGVTFDNFPAVAAMAGDVIETWQGFLPPEPEYTYQGDQWWQQAPGQIPQAVSPAPPPDMTTAQRNYEFLRTQGIPEAEALERAFGDGGTTVNVGPSESAFNTETGKVLAQEANEIVQQGALAQRNLGQIAVLEDALTRAPQGAAGGLASLASAFGIPFEGRDDVQVAEAIISQLVPQQRPPGSGTMSDADLALFRASLPRLANSPEGNRRIVQTLRAIAEYDVARGNIARRVQLGEISPAQAAQEYARLGNPIPPDLRGGSGGPPASAAAAPASAPTAPAALAGGAPDLSGMDAAAVAAWVAQRGGYQALTDEELEAIIAHGER